jgi:prepilin-type N-terminal cleavage/methylation domain-containing protein
MRNISNKGFTLIELVVSVTILSIIMLSVFSVFFLASDLNNKIDISRALQENVKNIVEVVAEDIREA